MSGSEESQTTPRLASLCFQLIVLSSDLDRQLNNLTKKLGIDKDQTIILLPAIHNITDRAKEKRRRKKEWKIEIRDIIKEAVIYDEDLSF